MLVSFDTETTGVDFHHGAMPFIVTFCSEDGNVTYYEWDVDPYTRIPKIPLADKKQVKATFGRQQTLIAHNPRFDVRAISTFIPDVLDIIKGGWSSIKDTLLLSHILASNQPHDLTTLSLIYVGVNILPYEEAMKEHIIEARKLAKSEFPKWRIAKAGDPTMPSAKETVWKLDMWLPRAIAQEKGYSSDHPWWNCTAEYANVDSTVTVPLYKKMLEILRERDLEKIYDFRLKLLPVIHTMEQSGITMSEDRTEELMIRLQEEANTSREACIEAADNEISHLPISGNSNDLKKIIFDKFKLTSHLTTDKGNPSLDKTVLSRWVDTLPQKSKPHKFITNLQRFRKRMTAVSYINSYHKFWKPCDDRGTMKVFPSVNPTGTDTLRFAYNNPNAQQVSKQEEVNLRYCYGPGPGREWWSLDAKNIELRLPAYESGERELIDLFEHPDDYPYYGSTHLLNFHTIYDDLWNKELGTICKECCKGQRVDEKLIGPHCKKKFASSWYQWVKNGGFAVQYGAVDITKEDTWGTADIAFHKKGAHSLLKARFSNLTELNQHWIDYANEHGYIETMPDITVDPEHGYPLLCTRSNWGRILETVPLNYRTQGTAMWVMCRMMVATNEWIQWYNTRPGLGASGPAFLALQVHDEIIIDLPKRKNMSNLPKLRKLKHALDQIGFDLIPQVPLTMGIEYHPVHWAEGITVA
jgi:DNA polymerase I-like protein with 3'-5' exonuclease and polymerase domains